MNINYLKNQGLKILKEFSPELESNRGLNVLAKSLGYKTFRQINHEYDIDEKTGEFMKDLVGSKSQSVLRISIIEKGFIFYQDKLEIHLRISREKSLLLKNKLDSPSSKQPH